MKRKNRPPPTEYDWSRVFDVRCRTKRGKEVTADEHDLCYRAYKEDPGRYGVLDRKVFEATKPFGADAGINLIGEDR